MKYKIICGDARNFQEVKDRAGGRGGGGGKDVPALSNSALRALENGTFLPGLLGGSLSVLSTAPGLFQLVFS